MIYVYKGKAVQAGQFVRLSSEGSEVLEVTRKAPWLNPEASFIGVWYRVTPTGTLRKVWL